MAEEKQTITEEKKPEKVEENKEAKVVETIEIKQEVKKEGEDKEKKKYQKEKNPKRNEAVVNGNDLRAGIKHSIAVCNFIRGKEIDSAIMDLDEVVKMKKAIPMRGEIPHRKGMMSGRYPVKAAGIYLKLLKSLKSNAIANEMELEKFRIFAMANVASRPYKRFGQGRFKRSHVVIKLLPITKNREK